MRLDHLVVTIVRVHDGAPLFIRHMSTQDCQRMPHLNLTGPYTPPQWTIHPVLAAQSAMLPDPFDQVIEIPVRWR